MATKMDVKVVRVLRLVSSRLSQKELVSLLFVSSWLNRCLSSSPSLWQPRYHLVKEISLEFAQDIKDQHLELLKTKHSHTLQNLESLNLNGCQKISDKGIEAISYAGPNLKVFSIYWNVRVTDTGMTYLVQNSRHIIDLNLSGCKVCQGLNAPFHATLLYMAKNGLGISRRSDLLLLLRDYLKVNVIFTSSEICQGHSVLV